MFTKIGISFWWIACRS